MVFPSEIMSQIFAYLTPTMLMEAARVSRTWRERAFDNRLWKRKFNNEGWGLDVGEIESFEQRYNSRKTADALAKASPRGKGKGKAFLRDLRKGNRPTSRGEHPQGASGPFRMPGRAVFRSSENAQAVGDEQAQDSGDDEEMPDVGSTSPHDSREPRYSLDPRNEREVLGGDETMVDMARQNPSLLPSKQESALGDKDEIPAHLGGPLLWGLPGNAQLNYHNVFKQKRKLEHNWDTGQYKSFQLPHIDHPEDAHTECVYTIQYSGKYLVSGSRDRTLRIWDLDTQRLVREPLQGHQGSVLCLQFDDRKEEDLIVSGSSDESVILWEFSTGRMIKRLHAAHKESVLNLKFDHRFLVTCSKDKTIKIWNRHALRPGDRDYPIKGVPSGGYCPDYILDLSSVGLALREPNLFPDKPMILEPYMHMMTLDHHGAAVNAIQIFKDELVSASGDRNIRVWNIHTGESSTKMEAHTKGIACVQYDGMRIVSGSSDRTIRIWDPISKTEVARLDGHTNLVRTIQAAFADYPGGRKNLEKEALEVERNFQTASMAGLINPESGRKSRGTPGSRKPKDFKSVGAKIPPSGGGGRWGRIVSGSYDETIIIWKKTEDDEWVISHRLRQEEALRAAGPPLLPRSEAQAQARVQANAPMTGTDPTMNPTHSAQQTQTMITAPLPAHQIASAMQAINYSAPSLPQAPPLPGAGPAGLGPANTVDGSGPQVPIPQGFNQQVMARAYHAVMQGQQQGAQPSLSQQPQIAGIASNNQNVLPAGQQPRPRPHPRPPAGGLGNQVPQVGQPNARVFKLQFDARRIICCSQDPKIVGWDFANGDEHIMECSRFFAAPQ